MNTRPKPIRLFYSRRRNGETNFGDDISPILVSRITGRPVTHARVSQCDYTAIGSIIEMIAERRMKRILHGRFSPIRVWGSGCLRSGNDISRIYFRALALRGEQTRLRLGYGKDLAIGDPGLLLGRLHRPAAAKRYKWGITAHYTDSDSPRIQRILERTANAVLIPLNIDPLETLRMIGECEHIASSSLHGLVTADTFGIPNWRVALESKLDGGDYKFDDYASAIGRKPPRAGPVPDSGDLDEILAEGYPDFSYMRTIDAVASRLEAALTASL